MFCHGLVESSRAGRVCFHFRSFARASSRHRKRQLRASGSLPRCTSLLVLTAHHRDRRSSTLVRQSCYMLVRTVQLGWETTGATTHFHSQIMKRSSTKSSSLWAYFQLHVQAIDIVSNTCVHPHRCHAIQFFYSLLRCNHRNVKPGTEASCAARANADTYRASSFVLA